MVLRAREEERRKLAREIHDGPAQVLANLVLRVEICQRLLERDPVQAREELARLKELLRGTLHGIREILADLRPLAVEELGFVEAARRYLAEVERRSGLRVRFALRGDGGALHLDPEAELAAYRLVQESVSNVLKHAGATRVDVTVTVGPRHLGLTVRDNGCGFDPSGIQPGSTGSGFGLAGMQERVELLGGTLKILSRAGVGTTVRIRIPLEACPGGTSAGVKESDPA